MKRQILLKKNKFVSVMLCFIIKLTIWMEGLLSLFWFQLDNSLSVSSGTCNINIAKLYMKQSQTKSQLLFWMSCGKKQ